MAHIHHDAHEVEVVEGDGASVAIGMIVAVATLLVVAIVALAVLWAAPWGDDDVNENPNVPGITDDSAPGVPREAPMEGGSGGEPAPAP